MVILAETVVTIINVSEVIVSHLIYIQTRKENSNDVELIDQMDFEQEDVVAVW